MDLKNFILIGIIFGLTKAEIVPFKACSDNGSSICTISEVRIDPCPEVATNEPCKVKRGRSVSIEFDYIPKFDAEIVEGKVFWATEIDLPFIGMDTEGCKYTKCPVVSNENHTYTFPISISKKLPKNTYDIKWRLTAGNNTENECCFITFIKLT